MKPVRFILPGIIDMPPATLTINAIWDGRCMTQVKKLIEALKELNFKDIIFAGVIEDADGTEKYLMSTSVDSPLRTLGLATQMFKTIEEAVNTQTQRDILE